MSEEEANSNLVETIFKYWKNHLLVVIFFGAISILVTSTTDKKYSSTGIVYPTKSNEIRNVVEDPGFGYQIHTDRLIQLFESNEMRNEMTKRFDLITYYDLDTLQPSWVNKLRKNFEKDVTINRTEYLSVEIIAQTKSPQLSADLVNNMISYVDTLRRNILLENTEILITDLKPRIIPQQRIVDSLLMEITNQEPNTNESQTSKNIQSQIERRKENGTQLQGDDVISTMIENNYSVQLEKLISEYYLQLGILNRYQTDLIKAKEKISLPFPKIYTVMQGIEDHKKTSPSFLIIGLISIASGFLLSIAYFSIRSQITKNKH